MNFHLHVSCPHCAGPVEVLTVGQPVCGQETSTIVHCPECSADWQAHVRLLPVNRKAT